MTDSWRQDLIAEQAVVEAALQAELAGRDAIPSRLRAAMAHSLCGGGKRLRPVLALWTWDALGDDGDRVVGAERHGAVDRAATLQAGAAIEMIHTYSLIHDDLPAMDDDVLRRGHPTCHVAFDEGTAILAGDGLQALAFGVLAEVGPRAAELVRHAARAAGPEGMVGGQQRDLDAEGQPIDAAGVIAIHRDKTAAMISLALKVGGVCRGLDEASVEALGSAGHWLGLAFQGADDLLDVSATSEELGKTPGKDAASDKATWIRVEGVEAARTRTLEYGARGRAELLAVVGDGSAASRLLALADFMWQREY